MRVSMLTPSQPDHAERDEPDDATDEAAGVVWGAADGRKVHRSHSIGHALGPEHSCRANEQDNAVDQEADPTDVDQPSIRHGTVVHRGHEHHLAERRLNGGEMSRDRCCSGTPHAKRRQQAAHV